MGSTEMLPNYQISLKRKKNYQISRFEHMREDWKHVTKKEKKKERKTA